MAMVFSPSTGFQDTTQFPDSDPQIRAHMQGLIEQIPAYVDEQLAETAIVETGNNANGNYIKFGDGTLICMLSHSIADVAIDSSLGSGLYYGTIQWTFPYAFASNSSPAVSCGSFKWGTGASWGGVRGLATANYANLIGYDIASRAAGTNVEISATAIGRWK